MPPPFVPWNYTGKSLTTILNRLAYGVFDTMVAPINRVLNQYRREWDLPPIRQPDDTFSNLAQLSQLVEEFDFPRIAKPPSLHYLGPFQDGDRPPEWFPYERLNGKSLVYASMGTVLNGDPAPFQVIAAACADLDVQLVLSIGSASRLDQSQLAGQPIVVEHAPQLELLRRAALCITHGGLNTVMESLRCGVPLVAIPVTNDQPAVAARLRRVGAGDVVSFSRLTPDRLRAAVQNVLRMPNYHQSADRLRTSIQQAGGVERAADIVEALISRPKGTGCR